MTGILCRLRQGRIAPCFGSEVPGALYCPQVRAGGEPLDKAEALPRPRIHCPDGGPRAVKKAVLIRRPAVPHVPSFLRHNLLAGGYDTRTVQELLAHKDVKTTMI